MTVFVPLTISAAQQLRSTGSATDLIGYADGPALRSWLGDPRLDDEEAHYVALNHAGVAALLLDGDSMRLVLAVDQEIAGGELGAVQLPRVAWSDVRSLFADEAGASAAVAKARAAANGLDLAAALSLPEVEQLLDAHDLLWYAPDELGALAAC
ncbi:MAG: hypothetical protein QM650_13575 [Microlunatus sp.]